MVLYHWLPRRRNQRASSFAAGTEPFLRKTGLRERLRFALKGRLAKFLGQFGQDLFFYYSFYSL